MSDADILELISEQATLEKGFRLLMTRYQERLYWHVRRMVVHHEDADDVIQNTFIKVFKGLSGFKGNAKLYTWLYRIATNETMSFLQKKKRHQTQSTDGEQDLTQNLQADPFFDGDEVQARLIEAIQQLPEKQRVVFNMRYYDEMKYAEMSEVLGTSVGALKASYHHAAKKIEHFFREASV
jgi:RNA polymerase sigma-70 factor, ECF subfamily